MATDRVKYLLKIKKLFYKIFKCYKIVDEHFVTYTQANRMIEEDRNWVLSPKEHSSEIFGFVWICKKVRITE